MRSFAIAKFPEGQGVAAAYILCEVVAEIYLGILFSNFYLTIILFE